MELRVVRADGSQRWVRSIATPHAEPDGSVIWDGLTFEITAQKEAERALLEERERLDAIARNLPGTIFTRVRHPDGRVEYPYVSDGLIKLLGWSGEEARIDSNLLVDATHPVDRDTWQDAYERSARTLEQCVFERRMYTRTRDLIWVRSIAQPRRLTDGTIIWDGISLDATEEHVAKAALSQTQDRLIEAIESVAEGFALFDENDRLVLSNEPYRRMFGAARELMEKGATFEEIVRRSVEDGHIADAAGKPDQWIAERVRAHRNPTGPFEQALSDGRVIRVTEHRTASNGIAGLRMDVTEIKTREAELVRRTGYLRAVLEHMHQGIVLYDTDLSIVLANDTWAEMLELPPEQGLPGQPYEALLRYLVRRGDFGGSRGEDELVADWLDRARDPDPLHYSWRTPKGLSLAIVRNPMPGGGFVTTLTDVTDAEQAAMELRTKEAQLRSIMDHIVDGILTVGDNGAIRSANPAASRIFGYGPEEIVGMQVRDLLPVQYSTGQEPSAPRGQALGTAISPREVVGRRKDGSQFSLDLGISLAPVGEEEVTVLLIYDLTEDKELRAQLFQASKLSTLGEMAAGMAHELNQPLSVISMAAENAALDIEDGVTDPDGLRRRFDSIHTQAQRMGEIIRHMRIFARRDRLSPEQFDPSQATRQAASMVAEQMTLDRVDLRLSTPDSAPHVLGHPIRLEQAVVNLVRNAHDAINSRAPGEDGPGPRRVTLALAVQAEDHKVAITVDDTGGGIPADVLPQLFDPFYTTKEPGMGTGLGLSVAYGIVAEMGGTLRADNIEGGARFTILLPTVIGDGAEDGKAEQ
ncbi:MAG: PAS-domain containing protein [Proteobacteria bacterium]|nr:PAS-domain containing protein [Pseudomonadota bacterium]